MPTIVISGASDDIVEIEAAGKDVVLGCDEYGFCAVGKSGYISASDGSVIQIGYAVDGTGCWRIRRLREGTATFTHKIVGDDNAEDTTAWPAYTDVAMLSGEIDWVKFHGKTAPKTNPPLDTSHPWPQKEKEPAPPPDPMKCKGCGGTFNPAGTARVVRVRDGDEAGDYHIRCFDNLTEGAPGTKVWNIQVMPQSALVPNQASEEGTR